MMNQNSVPQLHISDSESIYIPNRSRFSIAGFIFLIFETKMQLIFLSNVYISKRGAGA